MLSFLKVFARGIVVTLLLPIILLILALYGAYCLVLFVVMFFKGVIDYFRGNNFSADLPEDLEARRMVLEKEKADAQAKEMLNMMYQTTMAQAGFNQNQQQRDGMDFLNPQEPKQEVREEMNEGESSDDLRSY